MKMNFLLWLVDKYTNLMEEHYILRYLFIILFVVGLGYVMLNLISDDQELTAFKNRNQETIAYHPTISEIIIRDNRLIDSDRSFSIIPPETVVVTVEPNEYSNGKNYILIIEVLQ